MGWVLNVRNSSGRAISPTTKHSSAKDNSSVPAYTELNTSYVNKNLFSGENKPELLPASTTNCFYVSPFIGKPPGGGGDMAFCLEKNGGKDGNPHFLKRATTFEKPQLYTGYLIICCSA